MIYISHIIMLHTLNLHGCVIKYLSQTSLSEEIEKDDCISKWEGLGVFGVCRWWCLTYRVILHLDPAPIYYRDQTY